jgi:hypothetical protein
VSALRRLNRQRCGLLPPSRWVDLVSPLFSATGKIEEELERCDVDAGSWRHRERDLEAGEKWAVELMETHLSYPLLAFYPSQHVNQNWLAALTAMVDIAAAHHSTLYIESSWVLVWSVKYW